MEILENFILRAIELQINSNLIVDETDPDFEKIYGFSLQAFRAAINAENQKIKNENK